jgi:hypothetical protein
MTASSKSRDGEVRCLNCLSRFRPGTQAERAVCPACEIEWRISWPYARTGPVWEKYPRPEATKK